MWQIIGQYQGYQTAYTTPYSESRGSVPLNSPAARVAEPGSGGGPVLAVPSEPLPAPPPHPHLAAQPLGQPSQPTGSAATDLLP
jgi:hypothetical protein